MKTFGKILMGIGFLGFFVPNSSGMEHTLLTLSAMFTFVCGYGINHE